jgi:POT family proton-dependent oligopeptide transporter
MEATGAAAFDSTADRGGLGGHPRGLTTLFFTELWERFSYYGMRAILVLYMTAPVAAGGLGFVKTDAASIYGTYTMFVYLLALPGGWIADKFIGARRAVMVGAVIIACGHFSMVVHSLTFFYLGLSLIALGTGFLKPNISTLVGSLYSKDDPRRDGGFSLFYMGINLGAFAAPLVVGYLAEGLGFKSFLAARGFDPNGSWHWGFGAAGVGMLLGLAVYILQQNRLAHTDAQTATAADEPQAVAAKEPLTTSDWKRIGAILILFVFTILFWAAYEQKGITMNIFARDHVRNQIFGWTFPASWFQSLTPLYVIMLAPLFSLLWLRWGKRQPSSPAKFAAGLLFIGLAFALLFPAATLIGEGRISPLWLLAVYFLEVVGEMCLSPVGLSTVTKLSPAKLVGLMMGGWFFATSWGNKLAGVLAGWFVADNNFQYSKLYGTIAVGLLIAAAVLTLLTPTIKKMAGQQTAEQ